MLAATIPVLLTALTVQAADRVVQGALLASTDKALIAKFDRQFSPGETSSEFAKKFSDSRFLVADWGRRSAIVIDRELPYLKTMSDDIEVAKTITRHLKADLTFDMADLSPEERSAIKSFLGRTLPDWGEDRFDKATMGLNFSTIYTIRGTDGKSFTSHRGRKGEATKDRDAALQRKPYNADPGSLSKDEVAKKLQLVKEKQMAAQSIGFQCFGIAGQNLPEGLAESRKILDKLILELLTEKQAQTMALAKKAGIPTYGRGDEVPLGNLSSEQRDEALATFLETSSVHGFKDANEARQYFEGVSTVRVGTSLGVCFCTRPGAGQFKPPVYWGFELGSFYGSPP